MIDVAAEIQASDLRRRIGAERQPEEVQKLADTFDAMLERLEKAFSEQQHFVMDVSHELRTPLTVLKGNIDVMLMNSDLDDEARDQYERMSNEVSRLIRLTSNLLYMAGADAGREPEKRPLDLDVVCLEILRQGRDLRHDVKLSLGHEDQVTVLGDRDQVKQMVLNLVENAVKYTPSGGTVTLSVYQNGSYAQVEVVDSGPGIPPEMLPHIFQRFYRGNHRSMMGGTASARVAERIAAHGSIESERCRKGTFTVELPVAQPARGPARRGRALLERDDGLEVRSDSLAHLRGLDNVRLFRFVSASQRNRPLEIQQAALLRETGLYLFSPGRAVGDPFSAARLEAFPGLSSERLVGQLGHIKEARVTNQSGWHVHDWHFVHAQASDLIERCWQALLECRGLCADEVI